MQSGRIPSGKEGSSVIGEKLAGEVCDVDQRRDAASARADTALMSSGG
jgi:hypothetical protein